METISITNRGAIHKFLDDVFIDKIEKIYALCDLKISYYGVSITYKNTGQLKKYKRVKILHNYLSNNELERISFFSVPDNFVTVSYDYLLSISINYKNNFITAIFDGNIINQNFSFNCDDRLKNKNYNALENSYFVLGDNRPFSKDSRIIGCVQKEDIKGVLKVITAHYNDVNDLSKGKKIVPFVYF